MKNFPKLLLVALLTLGLFAGCVTPPQGGGAAQATEARQLVAQHQNAIITVLGTLKVSMTVRNMGVSEKNEAQVEAIGTVVDPSGIVIVGTLLLDPLGSIMRGPIRIQQGGQTLELDMKSDLENLRFLLADKTEVPARILLRDDDLGLFVLAADLKKGAKPPVFSAVTPTGETTPQLYTSYFVLGRANDMFQRAMLIGRGIPVNDLTKPRACQTFLTAMMPVGMPIFAADGQLAGIGGITFRKPDLEHPESAQNSRPLPVLLPVADVRELLARAKRPVAKTAVVAKPVAGTAAAIAEMPVAQARALIAAKQSALVTLRGTVKFTDGANPKVQEENIECIATVVDGSGFAVCGSAGHAVNRKYQEQRLSYILGDGTEVPARIVLQDDDLALTVLAPSPAAGGKAPEVPFLPLKNGVRAGLFDDVLTISRLDREHHYTLTAETSKITGVIEQPHPFYLADGNLGGRNVLGAPAFLADGRLLGLLAMTPENAQPHMRGGGAMQSEINIKQELVRIVPAGPVADLVEQAHQAAAKAPPKKD
ncbi:MAG: hypothetical protein NTY53_10050 [Kiritimatiellaeota bacterium]|nr:hypothetical protein [Kiritimatiellota bacterium]